MTALFNWLTSEHALSLSGWLWIVLPILVLVVMIIVGWTCAYLGAAEIIRRCFLLTAGLWLLSSCGPFIDMKHGIVHAGFMSSTQAFSGKIKCTDGSTAVWSVTGTDQTSVPNNLITTGGVGYGLAQASKSHVSDNNTSLAKQQDTNATAIKGQQLSNEAAAQSAETARKVTNDPLLINAGHFKP